MKSIALAFGLAFVVLFATIKPSASECCSIPIKCVVGGKTTYRCYDCSEATAYCGKGKCNVFGCSCDGGCRQGDSTLDCWNIASGCKLKHYFTTTDDNDLFFTAIDTDSDGKVSFSEAKNYIEEYRPTHKDIDFELRQLDTNSDGFLQFNEIDGN